MPRTHNIKTTFPKPEQVEMETLAKLLFDASAKNDALRWEHSAVPKKRYRTQAEKILSQGYRIVKEGE